MKLTHLANQKVIIARLTPVTAGSNKLALTTVTAALGHLQPQTRDYAQLVAGVTGKSYVIFIDGGIDIKENDQLRDESGAVYTVRKGGVNRWAMHAMDYQEVFLTKD